LVDEYRTPEIDSAMKHIERVKELGIPQIYIMDRNYVSLGFMQFFEQRGLKFLCRLKANSHYMEETASMSANDEFVEIKHTKHRRHRSRYANEELFQAVISTPHTRARIIKFQLPAGEIEYLITNIEDFSYDEIVHLYNARWGIETAYFSLKQKLQIEKFTSSIPQLIEQDFLSSVLAYNIIQTAKNETEQGIEQSRYKYEMKANENMAIGFVKKELIRIMIEDDSVKRIQLYDRLISKISKYKVPIRNDRTFPIRPKTDNNNSFNKLKSY
jgi:hypothetical protein